MQQAARFPNLLLCCLGIAMLGFGQPAAAQVTQPDVPVTGVETAPTTAEEAIADITPMVNPGDGFPDFSNFTPDYKAWTEVAERAEKMIVRDVSSRFALNRQRASLVEWRDAFSLLLNQYAGRLKTLNAQMTALGPAPEEGKDEPAPVANRRAALTEQRSTLTAPGFLVEEAFVRANGLISEIDTMIRKRETAQFLVRGQSPLNPEYWPNALKALWQGLRDLTAETTTAVRNDIKSGEVGRKLPLAILYFVIALVLLSRRRAWMATEPPAGTAPSNLASLTSLGGSLAQIVMPMIGLVALTLAIVTIDPAGLRSSSVFGAVPFAGFLIVVGRWLSLQFFPDGDNFGLLGYDLETRTQARRVATILAWIVGLWIPLIELLDSGTALEGAPVVINFPVIALLGLLLFRLGQLLARSPSPDLPEGHQQQGRVRKFAGQFCQLVAIAAPVAAAAGYAAASERVMLPTIISLAVIGVVIFLQRLVNDLYAVWARSRGRQSETLMPILIGFVLLILALPVLALVWGARASELFEIWARFREGFTVGETRISPTDFMTFVLTFTVGYLLTRLVQGTLRTTVLPRTHLDLGGQNAVVSGFGYLGIGLATIIAITSAGIDLSSLAFVAGALSVGIGFGLQNIVSNFVAGIILLIERPVSEGDWIEVGGQMGYVRDISVRSTRIETFDRTDVIVPNADLISNQVTNWTRGNLVGRVIVPVGVAYGSDVERVMEILREIAEAHPMVLLATPPSIYFQGFGASSLNFEIRAILRDVNFVVAVKSDMNTEIAKRFAAEGIEIPFPQSDIWLRNPETLAPQVRPAADLPEAQSNDTTKGDT